MVGRGDECLAKVAAGEDRDRLVEHVSEVVQPALTDETHRCTPLGVVDVVEHAELVVLPERRRPPAPLGRYSDDHGSRKSANRVRPPSTKIVWPVM